MPAQYPGIGFPPDSEVGLLRKITNNLALIAAGGGGGGNISSLNAGSGITITNPSGPIPTISASVGAGVANLATITNNAGNTTITPDVPLYDIAVTIGGSARTSSFALATAGRGTGDRCRILYTLPATPGIILIPKNNTTGGAALLPADIFTSPSQGYTTNGFDLSAKMEFEYTGSAWRYVTSKIPA